MKIAVEKGLQIPENISQDWVSKDFNAKQKLQYLVFPHGIRGMNEKSHSSNPKNQGDLKEEGEQAIIQFLGERGK